MNNLHEFRDLTSGAGAERQQMRIGLCRVVGTKSHPGIGSRFRLCRRMLPVNV